MENRTESPSWLPDAGQPAAADGTVPPGGASGAAREDGADSFTYGDDGYSYGEPGHYVYTPGDAQGSPDPGYTPAAGRFPGEVPAGSEPQSPPQGHTAQYALQPPQPIPSAGPAMAAQGAAPAPPAGASQKAPAPRRASLVVARLEPWSVMKFSFLMSLVAWIVLFVAVAVLYYFLNRIGVFASVQKTLQSVTSSQGSSGVKLSTYVSQSKVLGYTMLFGAINIVIITALSTIGAVIYNLIARIGGGIEVTLRERD